MKDLIKFSLITVLIVVIGFFMASCDDDTDLDNPSNIVGTRIESNTRTHLTWNAVSGASYYTIAYRTNLDSQDTRTSISGTSNTTYTHWYTTSSGSGVHTVYYYIKAQSHQWSSSDGYGESGWAVSSPVSVAP